VRVALHLLQNHDRALVRRKRIKGGAESPVLGRPLGAGGNVRRTVQPDLLATARLAPFHQGDPRRDALQPGAQPTSLLIPRQRLGKAHEHIMDDVLGVLSRAG